MPTMHDPTEAETLQKIQNLKTIINQCHVDFTRERAVDPQLKAMIDAADRIFLSAKAKRIRAIIPLLIAEEGLCELDSVKHYAVLIELLHFSSLVHDDVIDQAPERRDLPSLNSLYSNSNAVLIGDHFICESIQYALQTKHNTAVIAICVDAVKKLIAGVMLEQRLARDGFDLKTYQKMCEMKTGCLFSLSFGLPFVGTPHCELGLETGKQFGLLFQIYDDYLDRSEDHAGYNIFNAMSHESVAEKCQAIYGEVVDNCRTLGLESSLRQVVIYLKTHGYFFDVALP